MRTAFRFRPALALTASLAALVIAMPAAAQTTPADSTQDTTVAPTDDTQTVEDSGAIVVTGSRIRQAPGFDSPNPVVSIGADTIQESGTTNLTDFLSGYPALVGSSGSSANSGDRAGIGETGLNLLDLRNLGRARTLVLVDGRRHVAGVPGEQSVDINTIPSDLVSGIDVLTGGASAIYGADGVSGVVNFRMKQDFEGLSVRAQAGISDRGDAGQRLFSITAGKNFAGGRGNVALAYEYGADDQLMARNRRELSGTNPFVFVLNPNDPNDDPNLPDRIPLQNIRYGLSSPNGAVDIDGDYVPEFDGDGNIFDNGVDMGEGFVQGGSSTLVSRYYNDLFPKIERHVVNGLAHFDVSDGLTLFAEGKYANVRSFSLAQPTFEYGTFIEADNPYLPANIAAAIDPALGGVLVNRDYFDLGQRGEDIKRETLRFVGGARGELSEHLRYEASYVWGQTKVRSRYIGDIYNDRFFAAVDAVTDPATGRPTCRVNLDPAWTPNQPFESGRTVMDPTTFQPGQCLPINILGEGKSDPAAIAWITAPTTDYSTITQEVASASFSGDTGGFFNLPGGPVGFALGAEYRRESSSFNPDPIEQQGLTYTNVLSPTKGSFNVKEAFGEVSLPIVKDVTLLRRLEVGGAVRFSDYSTIGNTFTWKVNGTWSPVEDITFRGTYSVAIRAPNISELYSGLGQTFEFFNDPCLPANLNNGTSSRATNCSTLLTSLGANPATYDDTRTFNIPGMQGGNPNLTEEKAKTWTAGVVLTPSFIRGLTLSADWYDIRLNNAINTVDAQQLAELCVDQPDLNNVFCNAIVRQNGAGGPNVAAGNIIGFTKTPQNVAEFRTSGLELNLNWRIRTDNLGTFNLKVQGNYLDKLSFVGTPGADPTDSRGVAFAPKYQVNADLTWHSGPLTLNYGVLWFDKTLRYSNLTVAGDPDYVAPEYLYYKAHFTHDIYASVDVGDKFQLYGGVNNLFDQKPDIATTGLGGYPVDYRGRFLFVGAKVKLPKLF